MNQYRNCDIRVVIPRTNLERVEGLTYLNNHYASTVGVTLLPPDYLYVAYCNETVCGTLGSMTGTHSKPLRLSQTYRITTSDLPFRISLASSIEFGRWTSESSWISAKLINAAIIHSLTLGMSYVWCEHTPSVHRVARRFGIKFYPLSTEVISSMIEERYSAYYTSNRPGLYVFELTQAKEALAAHIASRINAV